MNADTLYFTFSTIPQTLAGGAAMLVAVVLYRLGEVDRTIETASAYLETAWRGHAFRRAWRALEQYGWKGVEAVARQWEGFSVTAEDQNTCRRAYRAIQLRRQIVFLLYTALALTILDILVCIVSIPVTPKLLRSPTDAAQVVLGTVVLTSICLGFYARLVWAMVQPVTKR